MTDLIRLHHLQLIRKYELQQVLPLFPKTEHILEIGAGAGWQAQWLSNQGYEVTAVDIPESRYLPSRVFPVILYDGINLPFSNNSFDIIFSSNVLEHIANPTEFNKELKRVIRPDGVAIHIVPTSTWRFWTILTHHVYIFRLVISYVKNLFVNDRTTYQPYHIENLSKIEMISRLLWPPRHGEQGTAISELYFFSKAYWYHYFEDYGWKIKNCFSIGLFYTGNQIFFSKLSLKTRRNLSKFLGSATIVFVLHI